MDGWTDGKLKSNLLKTWFYKQVVISWLNLEIAVFKLENDIIYSTNTNHLWC